MCQLASKWQEYLVRSVVSKTILEHLLKIMDASRAGGIESVLEAFLDRPNVHRMCDDVVVVRQVESDIIHRLHEWIAPFVCHNIFQNNLLQVRKLICGLVRRIA